MIGHVSPFQKWMNENLQGIAFSRDILEIVAMAFAGGLEEAAKIAERFEPDEKCSYVEYASTAIRKLK